MVATLKAEVRSSIRQIGGHMSEAKSMILLSTERRNARWTHQRRRSYRSCKMAFRKEIRLIIKTTSDIVQSGFFVGNIGVLLF